MERPNFKIGMDAFEALFEIVRANPEIKNLEFYAYKPHLNVKEMPESGDNMTRLLFHDSSDPDGSLQRIDITVDCIKEIANFFGKNREVLGVLSRVKIGRRVYHIPMMDFSCSESPDNLRRIERFFQITGWHGVILYSGRSYHFYGADLLNKDDWLNFLGDCLLSGLVDIRYVGHRLKDKRGILRISSSSLRPKIPTVVSIL